MKNKGYELVHFCECDKYAIQSYCAVHDEPEEKNLGDITKVDENTLKDFDVMFFGSPCQSFSISGRQAGSMWKCENCGEEYNPLTVHYTERKRCPKCGSENLSGTRSSLLIEAMRILKAKKPKWGVFENVKNLTGKKFIDTFNMFLAELQEYGYNTYYKVLNAKDYGIPQNRERVYVIFILKELDNGKFKFPKPFDNGLRMKDMLDDEVDDSYYINNERADNCIKDIIASGKLDKEYSNSIRVGGRSSLDRHQWDLIMIKK